MCASGTTVIVQPDLHRAAVISREQPLRASDRVRWTTLGCFPKNYVRHNEFWRAFYTGALFEGSPLCPGENRQSWRDNLGKELRVLEHARRVAAVARGRRGGRVAALELEHRTEHRRKSQEGLRELHRCNEHAKSTR